MTINHLIESAMRCVKCGATLRNGCDCWLELKCPLCGKTRTVERDKSDPAGTAEIHYPCTECGDESVAEVSYFDRQGKKIRASE